MSKSVSNLYQLLCDKPFLISGPCVIESEALLMRVAEQVKSMSERLGITYIFKASFDKANRTSLESFRGPGLDEGLRLLEKVKQNFELPLCSDIHESAQAKAAGEVLDIVQIPAFLCRQTDLLLAAGETGKIINIKKAQFLSGDDMIYPAKKVTSTGNTKILLTERGNIFGNKDLVVDMRNIIDMNTLGYPVVMDVTHATQKPGAAGGRSGGSPHYAPYFAAAAAVLGVKGFFIETHPKPEEALSDGSNMIPLEKLEAMLEKIIPLTKLAL
ncbi:MAG: 3-deoxy-8-phosphooctulonate synthase [Bernardetiaceae bacterium]|nr:3-deoxy-8-phosphooctulonate synthase [Bernardetiaceae bacterium]